MHGCIPARESNSFAVRGKRKGTLRTVLVALKRVYGPYTYLRYQGDMVSGFNLMLHVVLKVEPTSPYLEVQGS